jgi:hypothetical protein
MVWFKGFSSQRSGQMSDGVQTHFYTPERESTRWGVRYPDKSDKEPRHIWKTLLEPDLGTGHVRCTDLAREKAVRLDMSCLGAEYVRRPRDPVGQIWPNEISCWEIRVTGYVQSRGRTYLANLFGTR